MKNVTQYTIHDFDSSYYDGQKQGRDFDMKGEDYRRFISTCFKYSTCFSLIFRPDDENIPYLVKRLPYDKQRDLYEYDQYVIKRGISDCWAGQPGTGLIGEVRYYPCCSETMEMLYRFSDSLFKFRFSSDAGYNPEDLCFYREDGSVLFAMDIHEGEGVLFPKDDEDFKEVLETNPWYKSEYSLEWYNEYYNDLTVFMEKEDFLKK